MQRRDDALATLADLAHANAQDGWRLASMRSRFTALEKRQPWQATVATSHNLFPTPDAIVARMVAMAGILPGMRVLEPSCGTGRILAHLPSDAHAVEIHPRLASDCAARFPQMTITCADFLQWSCGKYDRIVMNPPFERGLDCRHIEHARTMLAPSGLIVALCYDGATQEKRLRPQAKTWEHLPARSFASEGTSAAVILCTL